MNASGPEKEETGAPRRLLPISMPVLFILLALLAYSSIISSYFLSDDFAQIGRVLEGDWSLSWGREHGGFFRPIFILSYILDSRLWGENPFGYHLTNILLHGLNSYLVYRLTLRLVSPQKLSPNWARSCSLAAGLLFLLHPSHTEAVSWISGRADLLAALFCLTAMLAFIAYVEKRGSLSPLLLSLPAFALALLSKESALSLPLVLLALGFYFAPAAEGKAAHGRVLKAVALFFPVLFLFVLMRRSALGAWLGGYGAAQHLNFSPGWLRDRFLQASLRALMPAFPQELSTHLLKPLKSPAFILCAIAALSLIILIVRRRRRSSGPSMRGEQNRLLLLLATIFILSLLPVTNLRLSLFDTQGERFIYWPSVFTAILVPYLALILLRSGRRWLIMMLVMLLFHSISLYRMNGTWKEAAELSRSIKEELVRATPTGKSPLVINAPDNLRGVPVYHNGLEEALRVFQKTGRVERARLIALHGLGSHADEMELKREADLFSLRLLNPRQVFTKVARGHDCVEIIEGSDHALRFRLNNCPADAELFLFNRGRIYRVVQ